MIERTKPSLPLRPRTMPLRPRTMPLRPRTIALRPRTMPLTKRTMPSSVPRWKGSRQLQRLMKPRSRYSSATVSVRSLRGRSRIWDAKYTRIIGQILGRACEPDWYGARCSEHVFSRSLSRVPVAAVEAACEIVTGIAMARGYLRVILYCNCRFYLRDVNTQYH